MDGDVIYFVDSSYLRNSLEALQEIPEQFTTPRGRLFKYTQSTKRLELLLSNLFFPNGISLTPQKDVLLISEMTRTRITK
jgi:sugar lactone lactonase YvrE